MTIATDDYKGLKYLIGCYYYQDWEEENPTVEAMVKALAQSEPPTLVAEVKADLDHLIDSKEDAASIDDWLSRIHCGGYVNRENPREQLIEFRDLLRKAMADQEASGRVALPKPLVDRPAASSQAQEERVEVATGSNEKVILPASWLEAVKDPRWGPKG